MKTRNTQHTHNQLLIGGARQDIKNIAGDTAQSLARSRPEKTLGKVLLKDRMKTVVPSSLGFFAPWLQIFSAAYLTALLGWFVGCVVFVPTCATIGMANTISKGVESNLSHGFAAGSIFFIVATFLYYLIDKVCVRGM
jgi:hypothetical protein